MVNGSPYSITEHRVPELIPVLGSQPAREVSHKPGARLPLLSARPAVSPPPATLRGLLLISLLGEQRHDGCNSLRKTVSQLRLEPRPFCAVCSRLTARLLFCKRSQLFLVL